MAESNLAIRVREVAMQVSAIGIVTSQGIQQRPRHYSSQARYIFGALDEREAGYEKNGRIKDTSWKDNTVESSVLKKK